MSTTPIPGLANQVATGSQPVRVANGGVGGGRLTNPLSATDQGLAVAEVLYVDPVGPCQPVGGALGAYGTIFALQPGETWNLVPGQTTATTVNAVSSGHRFSAVTW